MKTGSSRTGRVLNGAACFDGIIEAPEQDHCNEELSEIRVVFAVEFVHVLHRLKLDETSPWYGAAKLLWPAQSHGASEVLILVLLFQEIVNCHALEVLLEHQIDHRSKLMVVETEWVKMRTKRGIPQDKQWDAYREQVTNLGKAACC